METLLPGENIIWTSDPKIEIKREIKDKIEPTTVNDILHLSAIRYKDSVAFNYIKNSISCNKTWREFYSDIKKFARNLIFLGLEEYHSVMIQGFNSYEWAVSHFATIMAGGLSSGVYTTNSSKICNYMVEDCDAQIIIVEDFKQLNKYRTYVDKLKYKVKCFIVWNSIKLDEFWSNSAIPIHNWWDVLNNNEKIEKQLEMKLKERIIKQTPWRCNSLIYTSGTTGYPKGVMISHDNICWTAQRIMQIFNIDKSDRIVSYLPLSHIAAQALDFYIPLFSGAQVTFATPNALKGGLVLTLQSTKPTLFFGVPRVWEKISEAMVSKSKDNGCFKSGFVKFAKKIGLDNIKSLQRKKQKSLLFNIMNKLVFTKVKKALGLSSCKYFMTGAAPISEKTLDFFSSLNMPIMNLYGASESTGPITFNHPKEFKIYMKVPGYNHKRISCGKSFEGETVNLDSNNQIRCKGRNVFMGYIKKNNKTSVVFDKLGFYYTGDLGYLNENGFLSITGRSKEILITKGGENVAPVLIENNIKKELPNLVSNVVVIGDDKKYLTCLITLKCIQNEDGSFQTKLSPDIHNCIKDKVLLEMYSLPHYTKLLEKDEYLNKLIMDGIQAANKVAVSRAQTIKKYKIIPGDFSVPGGELTPTMKIKRNIVNKKYKNIIDTMYQN